MFFIYNGLLLLLSPVWALYALLRGLSGKEARWDERFGRVKVVERRGYPRVWIHAVSAGEVAAAAPIIRSLLSRRPESLVFLSTITRAGREMASKVCSQVAQTFYFPVDLPWAVRKALSAVRPDVVVLVEGEVWPNFIFEAERRGIPVVLVSGRISERGYRRSALVKPFLRWAFGGICALGMQTEGDAERIVGLGAPSERVRVMGSAKYDEEAAPLSDADVAGLRSSLGLAEDEPVLVAGSTRPGEEEQILEAYRILLERFPNLKLMLAPRHLERVKEVEELVARAGYTCTKRTELLRGGGKPVLNVILLDTMGELGRIYAVASVAFVGGTLVPIGGHNILQPIAQGKPVFFGPYVHGIRDAAAQAIEAGVGFRINSGAELALEAAKLLSNSALLAELRAKCLGLVEANRGAAERYAQLILEAAERNCRPHQEVLTFN
ncbi:MAG: 3-deoxy-D-manno-octulosonic acid transferase [Armatimonadota bacterium]